MGTHFPVSHRITGHLGSGHFCKVGKGIWQSPAGAMAVAVKQLQHEASEEEKVKFLQEAAINEQFRHPNVVKLMGVVTIGEPVSLWSCLCWHLACHFILLPHILQVNGNFYAST